ncbi:MAG: aquaporin [Alphaproteobacteria bacterium]|nr:aquaporin [Alphaproteobacteria bacterium]
MKKYIAELFGTFVLVFVGCGTVVFSAPYVGHVGIALAFGLALMAMVYAIGPVSGCHVNPAVTFGVFCAGRMKFVDVIGYVLFQLGGAALAAWLIKYMAVEGHINGYDLANGLGQNGWGENYAGGYTMTAAIIFEFIATFIFVKVILKTTECDLRIAGVVIGLTLAVMHILGLPITGVSVNPARSFGPAIMLQGEALQQLWLFLAVPSVAGILAGICSRCCACCCHCKCGDKCTCGCQEGKECTCGENCSCKTYEPNLDAKAAENRPARRPVRRGAPRRRAPAQRAK